MINAFNYVSDIGLTNIVAGHHSVEALNVENFERINGAVDYVFGVYNSLIVAVYKPSEWFICKDAKDKLPRQD